jgi:hypothetical protein
MTEGEFYFLILSSFPHFLPNSTILIASLKLLLFGVKLYYQGDSQVVVIDLQGPSSQLA